MDNKLTTAARAFAKQNGIRCAVAAGVAYDITDNALGVMAEALLKLVRGTGINLLSLRRDGDTLVAEVNDAQAGEPLCPAAFHRVVRKLSCDLLGQVWNGRLAPETGAPRLTEFNQPRVA